MARKRKSKLTFARRFAYDVLRATRERDGYVREIFNAAEAPLYSQGRLPDAREIEFARAISFGVTSCLGTLDELIDRNLNSPRDVKPKLRDALRISAWEMLFSTREDYAVVDQGVELARHAAPPAAGLANAVLRKMARDAKGFPWGDPETDMAALARSVGMPLWLTQEMMESCGPVAARMLEAMLWPAPFYSIQACPDGRFDARGGEGEGGEDGEGGEGGACPDAGGRGGRYVQLSFDRPEDGAPPPRTEIVSDLAARYVASIVPLEGAVLEVGAGRGTKTALMQLRAASEYGHGADIHALDVHGFKRALLHERLEKLGLPDVKAYVGDGRRLDEVDGLPPLFNAVLVDAPCSGTGTFRRHPEGRWRLSPGDVESLVALQGELLAAASARVAKGGVLVYSTCSVLPQENEEVVRAFLAGETGAGFSQLELSDEGFSQPNWRITREGAFQSTPAMGCSDGHFAAAFVRGGAGGPRLPDEGARLFWDCSPVEVEEEFCNREFYFSFDPKTWWR